MESRQGGRRPHPPRTVAPPENSQRPRGPDDGIEAKRHHFPPGSKRQPVSRPGRGWCITGVGRGYRRGASGGQAPPGQQQAALREDRPRIPRPRRSTTTTTQKAAAFPPPPLSLSWPRWGVRGREAAEGRAVAWPGDWKRHKLEIDTKHMSNVIRELSDSTRNFHANTVNFCNFTPFTAPQPPVSASLSFPRRALRRLKGCLDKGVRSAQPAEQARRRETHRHLSAHLNPQAFHLSKSVPCVVVPRPKGDDDNDDQRLRPTQRRYGPGWCPRATRSDPSANPRNSCHMA